MDYQLRDQGLTHVLWITLWRIAESATALNQTDLARRVGIENSTLVRQLDALEERGLIERVVDKDRRARRIRLTPAAGPALELVKDVASRLSREVLAGVAPAQLAGATELLHAMRGRLRERASAPSETPADE
jgi:MarR family transcriptional regulator, transcriptional regulator for hemolysin